jgi:serine/threonine-protein kinase
MNPAPAPVHEFGDFRVDAVRRRLLRRDGTPVSLTPKVFDTLLFLVEHHDTVLDKERLMEAVWPDSIVEENNLSQNISTLRRVFGDSPGSHDYIVTVPGRGYRFVAEVTRPANHAVPLTQTTAQPAVAEPKPALVTPAGKPRGVSWVIPALILLLLGGLAVFWFLRSPAQVPLSSTAQSTAAIPGKSIAVLPFANLSADQENAFFTEGMQDDILTALAKVADLKVISRTSVASYVAGPQRNLREIGRELGVSQILEGSVRRVGDKVRVTVQLIDTRTNIHLWAESYDRNLGDVFAIQTEIAQQIATQLQAKLSPVEKSEIEARPTGDLAAYDLYLRAKALWRGWTAPIPDTAILSEIAKVLEQAIARDPQFFLAYCHLARVHDAIYFSGSDRTPSRLTLAETAIAAAARLRPGSGEAHLVRAEHLYRGYLDYDSARAELDLAQCTLPNDAEIFALMAHIDRRQGRWSESTRNYEKALELSPRDPSFLGNAAVNYEYQRRFAGAVALRDRVLKLFPQGVIARYLRASIDLAWRADPQPLHDTIEAIIKENPLAAADLAEGWLYLALCERDPVMTGRALAAIKNGNPANPTGFPFPRSWFEGLAARARGDEAAAHSAFASARVEAEATVLKQPDDGPDLSILGLIDAAIGHKDEAIREGRRAAELLPVAKNSMEGARIMEHLALIYAWTGEKELALDQLAATLQIPSQLSYGYLRLHPFWDPLRGDARFEKIVTDLAPKEVSP